MTERDHRNRGASPASSRREDEETTQQMILERMSERPRAARDRCTLVMVTGNLPGQTIAIRHRTASLGRGSKATIRIEDPGLSRVHAEIEQTSSRWFVRDLESTNGTWINGERVAGPRELKDRDQLRLGNQATFRISIHDEAEQTAAVELYASAVTDPLTQVHNRRHMDERLEGEFAYSGRHDVPLSFLLIDVDHFKQVNDHHGHPAGDTVLRRLAKRLEEITRTEDVVARYGGEEFAVIARGIDLAGAKLLAERIRTAVEALRIQHEDATLSITVSIGIASKAGIGGIDQVEAFVEAADKALYRAKRGGRNRFVADGE